MMDDTLIEGDNPLNIQLAPMMLFAYVGDVRYIYPYFVPAYRGNGGRGASYQAFEVKVKNQGSVATECVLQCYIQIQPVSDEGVKRAKRDWRPDTEFEATWWCKDPDWLCYSAEPYRIKKVVIQPGGIATFRGLAWYHFFGEYDHRMWAKFVGEPGEIISAMVKVEPYA